jgi:N,N-dimethylformamidase
MSTDDCIISPVILAYSDRNSVRPGDDIQFMVSCEGVTDYCADIVRLGCCDGGQTEPAFRESLVTTDVSGWYPARKQAINIGSSIRVPDPQQLTAVPNFTMTVYVWPTRLGIGRQALMGTWREQSNVGYGLEIDAQGHLSLRVGDGHRFGTVRLPTPLSERRWQLVGVRFNADDLRATLFCEPQQDKQFPVLEATEETFTLDVMTDTLTTEFCLAAWPLGNATATSCHLDGKLDRPRLSRRALKNDELAELVSLEPDVLPSSTLIGAWDFSQEIETDVVTDISGNELHGKTGNLPMRAVTGVNWTGAEFDWRHATSQYGAIHFHSDDIYAAEWQRDFGLRVTKSMSSGIYAARLRAEETEYYVPFFVRPTFDEDCAKLLFLVPTATYMAYANIKVRIVSPYTDVLTGKLTVVDALDLLMLNRPELGLSTYDAHEDGSPVHYSSRLRPVINYRPKESDLTMAYNNFACDLLLIDWLEHLGVDFDVMTDEDLHHEGLDALSNYRAVMTGTHPEYCSLQMLDALDGFVRGGGRLMYMGGNGFYWRIAFSEDMPGVIEHRRAQQNIARWNPGPGQSFHSFSGEHGGIWWDLGRAPQLLTGVGFVAQGFDVGAAYGRKPAANDPHTAFIFEGVDAEIIGDFGLMPGGVAGIEIDRFSPRRGSPSNAVVVASSSGHSRLYETLDEVSPDGIDTETGDEAVRADMVYFECPAKGAVFSVGSIAYAFGLAHNNYDNNVSRITENVLKRFVAD